MVFSTFTMKCRTFLTAWYAWHAWHTMHTRHAMHGIPCMHAWHAMHGMQCMACMIGRSLGRSVARSANYEHLKIRKTKNNKSKSTFFNWKIKDRSFPTNLDRPNSMRATRNAEMPQTKKLFLKQQSVSSVTRRCAPNASAGIAKR